MTVTEAWTPGPQGLRQLRSRLDGTIRHENPKQTIIGLWDWIIIVDLDFNATLGCKLGDDDGICDFSKDGGISFTFQTIVEGVQVSSSDDVLKMKRLENHDQQMHNY